LKIVFALAVVLLLFGCLEKNEQDGGDGNVIKYQVTECQNITYETNECWRVNFNYSAGPLKKLEPYRMDVFCVGGGSISIKNLEKESGTFRVAFIFTSQIEGKVTKSVEKEIGPKATAEFEEKTQFRCGQDYQAQVKIGLPTKEVCGVVNRTREECNVG